MYNNIVDRRPIDPPPVLQLIVETNDSDSDEIWLNNPYYVVIASLVNAETGSVVELEGKAKTPLAGNCTSSGFRLKDMNNNDALFFVFQDLSVRIDGTFKLRFDLFELVQQSDKAYYCATAKSNSFKVYLAKHFPGLNESTPLSRYLADHGIKMRVRNDARKRRRIEPKYLENSEEFDEEVIYPSPKWLNTRRLAYSLNGVLHTHDERNERPPTDNQKSAFTVYNPISLIESTESRCTKDDDIFFSI
ncbi:hypothetical protein ROZALSC1DRAFT_26506 [Rozella allomycis CSF55]|uniref:Velvet factor domain-containing protein n=1 Tax=Rozella allomycis (strain CSF55) TaxID=988480 RepID=A0A075B479_ROZAC|nr:Velvet factor domain-containing protein [Rozella allomycis CSF55]RKP22123.1 hypothetical protein ROZALSC1DRAFT_26506 [Rozella allomycis CSF55]|eukprot:EPZ35961.1 Velvet factor domain-containing protein [Rozella allomycis CSF55]